MPPKTETTLATRAPSAVRRKLSAAASKRLTHRLDAVLGREKVIAALEMIDDTRAVGLMNDLANPIDKVWARATLYTLAKRHGIGYPELFRWMTRAHLDVAMLEVAQATPDIMRDVCADARNVTESCWVCDGTGTVTVVPKRKGAEVIEQPCSECRATGAITRKGDTESRKLALEYTGAISKRGPLLNLNIGSGAPAESFESLIGRAGDIIHGPDAPAIPALASAVSDDEGGA